MRRRKFVTLLGGAAAAASGAVWPLAARAQRATIPVVGFLRSVPFAGAAPLVDAFRQGLKEAGFVEGQNVAVEFRSAEGHLDRLPGLVADLVRRPVNVLNCNNAAALVAKAATATIPIIFSTGSDPVRDGLVASLNRPGGNLTGASFISGGLGGKRLELLSQLVSKSAVIAMLVNPASAEARGERQDVEAAAQALGKKVIVVEVDSDADVDNAFATFHQRGVGAVLVGAGGFMFSRREQLIALVSRHRLPVTFTSREAAVAGALMSYAGSQRDAYHQSGIYTGRVLKGELPADLPVLLPTKFELVLNMKTAKAQGFEIPDRLLALADEVIE